jgi:hypothetical protein
MELRGGPGPAALQQLANRKPPVTSISGATPASTLCRQKDSEGQGAFGVTRIPGRQAGTKAAGRGGAADSKNGPQCGRFCGLVGACPNHEISGGKVLSGNTKKVKHPAARAFQWRHNPCKRAGRSWGDCRVVCEPGKGPGKPSPRWATSCPACFDTW